MSLRRMRLLFCLALLVTLLLMMPPSLVIGIKSQTELRYQDRGNRYEGVKGSPVSARVDFISALADYRENVGMTDQFKLKFYLSEKTQVYITIRELDNRRNYWMDRIRPSSDWRTGFGNEFQWPSQEVVRPLGLQLTNLGAVVQLGSEEPSQDVRVAPAILYQSSPPRTIGKYLFTFMIGRKADATCSFSRDEDNSPILSTESFQMIGRRPRTCSWNASRASEGWYRLSVKITYSNNNEEANKVVHFYHRPSVR